MKILNVVESLSTLFPKKARIKLIHAVSGRELTFHTIKTSEIPEVFNKPTLLNINDQNWRITKAEIAKEESYFSPKALVLHVIEPELYNQGNKYLVPTTMSAPELTQSPPIKEDFTLNMNIEDWQQIGFFPSSALAEIQGMTGLVLSIINASNDKNVLLGYDDCYKREYIAACSLRLDFDQFIQFAGAYSVGSVSINNADFVLDGFCCSSGNHTYYGQVKNNVITSLALQQFDHIDEELFDMLNHYDLFLADWCNGAILA